VAHVSPRDPNRRFYGTVTVSDRGQVVIPAEARRDLGISVGDKLLVFGDLSFGLAFGKADEVLARVPGVAHLLGGSSEPSDRSQSTDE
jgi:AbrB family looped-hinge helix DNA binding protein